MRHFAAPGLRLWNLAREAKLVYTCFCVLSIFAMASSVLLYEDVAGRSPRPDRQLAAVRRYYAADPQPLHAEPQKASPTQPAVDPQLGGPDIALPADAEQSLSVTMPYRKLLEITHFHLFTVPVFLLIISHLFMLTGLSPRARLAWIIVCWGSAAAHIAAPWVVRAGVGAALFPLSGVALLLASAVLSIYPIIGMWRRPPGRPQPATEGPR